MANAARDKPHKHLARSRLLEIEFLHLERQTELFENSGPDLHRSILSHRALSCRGECGTHW